MTGVQSDTQSHLHTLRKNTAFIICPFFRFVLIIIRFQLSTAVHATMTQMALICFWKTFLTFLFSQFNEKLFCVLSRIGCGTVQNALMQCGLIFVISTFCLHCNYRVWKQKCCEFNSKTLMSLPRDDSAHFWRASLPSIPRFYYIIYMY